MPIRLPVGDVELYYQNRASRRGPSHRHTDDAQTIGIIDVEVSGADQRHIGELEITIQRIEVDGSRLHPAGTGNRGLNTDLHHLDVEESGQPEVHQVEDADKAVIRDQTSGITGGRVTVQDRLR